VLYHNVDNSKDTPVQSRQPCIYLQECMRWNSDCSV